MDESIRSKNEQDDDLDPDVQKWEPGMYIPENKIAVRARFHEMVAIKVDVEPQNDEGGVAVPKTFLCLRTHQQPYNESSAALMELTGASTVNLWYELCDENGATLHSVEDLMMLRTLEGSLALYDEHKKESTQ
jgi:hypothetical protein